MFQHPYLRHNHVNPLRDDQHDPSVLPEKRQRLQRLKDATLIRENLKQRCYVVFFFINVLCFSFDIFQFKQITFLKNRNVNIILDVLFLR